jgi:hypothetical protein
LEQKPPVNAFKEKILHSGRMLLFIFGLLGLFPLSVFLYKTLVEERYLQAASIVGPIGLLALITTVSMLVRTRKVLELRSCGQVIFLFILILGGLILFPCLAYLVLCFVVAFI